MNYINNLTPDILNQYANNPSEAASNLTDSEIANLQEILKAQKDQVTHYSSVLQKVILSKHGDQANAVRESKNTKGQVSFNSNENPLLTISSTSALTTKWDSKSFWSHAVAKIPQSAFYDFIKDLTSLGVDFKLNVTDSNWLKIKAGDTELHKAAKKHLEHFRTVEPKAPTFNIKQKKEKEDK
tara:strand:+ start:157 stop:705 length:549 start_codon:yes stop_codon:yes gene_type:complete